MKTGSKKSTITIITLACLLAVAVASTVILAAFSAVRTSTTTITFANGLEMSLASKGTESTIQITQNPDGMANYGTFAYSTAATYEATVNLDGITATLSKDGWVAYQITLQETITTPAQGGGDPTVTTSAIAGSWAQVLDTENENAPTNSVVFTPNDPGTNAKNNWKATLTVNAAAVTVTAVNNVVTVKFNDKWEGTGGAAPAAQDLFTLISIDGTTPGNVNDLAGRVIVADFVIKADTSDGIGASNDQNPITFA